MFVYHLNWRRMALSHIIAINGALLAATPLLGAQQSQSAALDDSADVQTGTQQSSDQHATQHRQAAPEQKQQRKQQSSSQRKTQKHTADNSNHSAQTPDEGADVANNHQVRQFHEVLNELLTEFAYDIKQGQINGLKNISIRRVTVSDALPRTYEQYVELLVSERIRENAKVRIINCVACKTKSSTLMDGKLMITSPLTNMQRMDEAATQLNIENFMDVVLVYHTTHMVLAFSVFNTTTKEEMWSRTYNSETLRSRYQKQAVDFNQVEKSRVSDEYVPEYKFLLGVGGSQLPNVAGTTRDKSFLSVHLRSVEKFDNRKIDFGLLTSVWLNTSNLLKAYPSEGTQSETSDTAYNGDARPIAYKYLVGFHAIVARNFLGDVESYDRIRHGVHLGLGGVFSTGYLAPSVRLGWDVYFGRRFVCTFAGHYINSSTILVGSEYQHSRAGGGGDLVLSLNL